MTSRRTKVLIVEDHDDLRGMFRTALAIEGFDVVEARNGLDALHRIDEDPPDVVILDINLPLVSGVTGANRLPRTPPRVIFPSWS